MPCKTSGGGVCISARQKSRCIRGISFKHSRALPQAFILPQAFRKVGRKSFARNAAPPMILPSAFSRLAVRAATIKSPPPRHIALHRLAAKRAFAFGIRGAAFGIRGVLRHLQESGAFAGARRKSGAPCCAVRRFPPRRRYIIHPNSRQLSAFVFSRGRISFGIYRCKKRHCRTRKKMHRCIVCKSSAAAGFFAGAVVRRCGIRFRGGAAYHSSRGGAFANRHIFRISAIPSAAAGGFAARAASARKAIFGNSPNSRISRRIRRFRRRNGRIIIGGAFRANSGRKRKEFGIHITGRKSGFAVAVLFAGFRAAPPKAAAVLCL